MSQTRPQPSRRPTGSSPSTSPHSATSTGAAASAPTQHPDDVEAHNDESPSTIPGQGATDTSNEAPTITPPDSSSEGDAAEASRNQRRAPSHQSRPGPEDDIALSTGRPTRTAGATASSAHPTREQLRRRPGNRAWVPRQHGAWGMLIIPPLAGMILGGWSLLDLLVLPAWWGAYLTFWSWTQWLYTRSEVKRLLLRIPLMAYTLLTVIVGLVTLTSGIYLVRWGVLFVPIAAIAAFEVWRGRGRSLVSGIATTAAASLMTAVTYDVGTHGRGGWLGLGPLAHSLPGACPNGTLTGWSWTWLVTSCIAAYFMGTVPYVKSMIRARGNIALIIITGILHTLAAAGSITLATMGHLSWAHALVWVMLSLRSWILPTYQAWRVRTRRGALRPRIVGFGEVVASLLVLITVMV